MLEFIAPLAAIISWQASAAEVDDPISENDITEARSACNLAGTAKFIDAREMASADELATMLEAFDHPKAIVFEPNFAGEDITVLLGKLAGGCFYNADLSKTNAAGAEFNNSVIAKSSIAGADWSGALLDQTRFIGVDASAANLSGAVMRGGSWAGRYWNSNLEKADFTGALMLGFRFDCGITMDEACGGSSGAIFDRVDFSAADIAEFPAWGADSFNKAFFEGTRIHPRAVTGMTGMEIGSGVILAPYSQQTGKLAGGSPELGVSITAAEFASLRDDALKASLDTPSFDCAKAGNFAEKEVCGEYSSNLRKLDRDLARAYDIVRKTNRTAPRDQNKWLAKRDACTESECVENVYKARISELLTNIGTELILAPDASITFNQDVLPLTGAMRRSALYKRILPMLEKSSRQEVTLTGLEDGSIRIEGMAVGANAHTCNWEGEARYVASTGWYTAISRQGQAIPLLRVWEGRLTPFYSGNLGDTPAEASDFISCGARAGFDEMRALGGELD